MSTEIGYWLKLCAAAVILTSTVGCSESKVMSEQAQAGKLAFDRQCAICHQIGRSSGKGPDLSDVVGRQAGSVKQYVFSSALQDAGFTWTPEKLDVFLKNPQSAVPGTEMGFFGIDDPEIRASLIAYLDELGK